MTVSGRLRRKIRSAVVLLLGIVSVLAAAGWAERERNAGEEYSVYSAYLSEGLSNDAHFAHRLGPVTSSEISLKLE
jgi:hypothetical protein